MGLSERAQLAVIWVPIWIVILGLLVLACVFGWMPAWIILFVLMIGFACIPMAMGASEDERYRLRSRLLQCVIYLADMSGDHIREVLAKEMAK